MITSEQETHGAAAIVAEALAGTETLFGKKRTASGAQLGDSTPGFGPSDAFLRLQAGNDKKPAEEATEYDIGSKPGEDKELSDNPEAMEKAQKEYEEAQKRDEARKEKIKKDHEDASGSGGAPGLPAGMGLPKMRPHPEGDDLKTMIDTMHQFMNQVHNLSRALNAVKEQIKEKETVIEKLKSGSGAAEPERGFGKGPPQPVENEIAEKPKKYIGNVLECVPWQEQL
jgi:hypothetical protein